jgi:cytochrome P450
MAQVTDYVPFDPEFKANPFPFYAHLREEQPVYRTTLADGRPLWLVTRYEDVVAVLRDERFVKDVTHALTPEQLAQQPPVSPVLDLLAHDLLNQDPPNHTRLRALVSKAFTPRLVEGMRPRIQQLADELLDAMAPRGEADLMAEYAFPIPIVVIAELLGVPPEDRERFKAWSDAIVSINPTPEGLAALETSVAEFTAYLGELFAKRRRDPKDDLISGLVHVEEGGDRLTENERLHHPDRGPRDDGQPDRDRDAGAAPASGPAPATQGRSGADQAGRRGAAPPQRPGRRLDRSVRRRGHRDRRRRDPARRDGLRGAGICEPRLASLRGP